MIHIAYSFAKTFCGINLLPNHEVENPVDSERPREDWCPKCLNIWERTFATTYQAKEVWDGRVGEETKELG